MITKEYDSWHISKEFEYSNMHERNKHETFHQTREYPPTSCSASYSFNIPLKC